MYSGVGFRDAPIIMRRGTTSVKKNKKGLGVVSSSHSGCSIRGLNLHKTINSKYTSPPRSRLDGRAMHLQTVESKVMHQGWKFSTDSGAFEVLDNKYEARRLVTNRVG